MNTAATSSTPPSYADRLRWFHEARFGMFIHFGLYSLLERGEWVMFRERIRPDDYAKLADTFCPAQFDADVWAKVAVDAGMRYAVLTARHHDGYCLYDSRTTDFTSTKTAARRDFVAEFVVACRSAGLRVGIYYSLLDWRYPGYFEPKRHPDSAKELVQQAHDQVRELMTNYGNIDQLWYDGDWISHGRIKDINIAEFWRAEELNAMVRELQPGIIINNRAGVKADIDTPEQHVTASEPGRGWESCMTMGDPAGWGYVRHSPNFKTVPQLLQNLVTAAAGEGNFLLNVGPRPDGSIRDSEVSRLREMGEWLRCHGEAIYGSQRCDFVDDRQPGGGVGMWTRKGNSAYLNVFRWPGEELVIPLVPQAPLAVSVLGSSAQPVWRMGYNNRLIISSLPEQPSHPYVSVVKFDFAEPPQSLAEEDTSAWLTGRAGNREPNSDFKTPHLTTH